LLIFTLGWGTFSVVFADEPLSIQTQNDVAYVSGGIGEDERATLAEMARGFNLRLAFATLEGKYLNQVRVQILDQQGNTVLETTSQGPWFYADLAPGTYTIQVRGPNEFDKSYQKTAEVSRQEQTRMIFHWPH